MILDYNGNVGIGTTSPGAKLEVNERNNANTSTTSLIVNGILKITDGHRRTSYNDGKIQLGGNSGKENMIIGDTNGFIKFQTNGYNDRMIINESGNVGIGTTSPEAKLDIHTSSNDIALRLRGYGHSSGVQGRTGIAFHQIANTPLSSYKPQAEIILQEVGNASSQGDLLFKIKQTSGYKVDPTTAMILNYKGHVGIGTTSPRAPLHVESWSSGTDDNQTKASVVGNGESYSAFIANPLYDSGTQTAWITWATDWTDSMSIYAKEDIFTNSALVAFNGTWASSDERIKCEIENVPDDLALNQVLALETKYYHYKDPKRRETEKTIGFIAQEVESIIPGTVVKRQQFIPNILKAGDAIWTPKETDTSGNTIMWNLQVANLQDISANTEVKFYFYNGDISNNTDIIEYEKDLTAIDASNNFEIDTKYEHVFVFGVKVNDFRTIKKEKIFALHHSAIQQIHKNAETEKAKLAEAESEITTLKSTVETQQTTINTLQSTLAALEARIAALENP